MALYQAVKNTRFGLGGGGGCGGGRCTGPLDTKQAGMRALGVPVGRNAKRVDLATGHLKRECKRKITALEAIPGSIIAVC